MKEEQKKLLILGGTRISLQILEAAKDMGLKVYVTDYNEDSPCKEYADKNFNISATDTDAVVKLIETEKIDGVLMGYADVLMPAYVDICKKANLPCYANERAVEVTFNKKKFKEYCREYSIPVVEEYSYKDVMEDKAKFPVIVKPVDNSGARGIFICNSKKEFDNNYSESLKYSKTGNVIIERLITAPEATIFYYLHDGVIYLLGIGDRWMYEQDERLLKLPIGYTFPSMSLPSFIENENDHIVEMFESLNMREGMVFIQTFIENGKNVVYEMGYRLTGSLEHHLFEKQYGFNHLKAIINFAVGNKVDVEKIKDLDPIEGHMANVTMLLQKGKIDHIEGLEELKKIPEVIDFHVSHIPGEVIDDDLIGKLSQVGLRILITAECREKLVEIMDKVKEIVKVVSTEGKDMIIKNYSYSDVCQIK